MIKGCYASLCQGFVLVFGFLNAFCGIGLLIVGFYLCFDFTAIELGYRWFAVLILLAGLSVLSITGMSTYGAIRERRGMLQTAFFLSMLNALVIMTLLAICIFSSGNIKDASRDTWFGLPQDERTTIEQRLSCCGYDDPSDSATENCRFKTPCANAFTSKVASWLKTGVTVTGIALIVHVITGASTGCLWLKVGKPVLTKFQKALTLQDEIDLQKGRITKKDLESGQHYAAARRDSVGAARHYDKHGGRRK